MSNKQKKITVLLDAEDFKRFSDFCHVNGFKKSTLLARLLREFLENEDVTNEGHRSFRNNSRSD